MIQKFSREKVHFSRSLFSDRGQLTVFFGKVDVLLCLFNESHLFAKSISFMLHVRPLTFLRLLHILYQREDHKTLRFFTCYAMAVIPGSHNWEYPSVSSPKGRKIGKAAEQKQLFNKPLSRGTLFANSLNVNCYSARLL